MVPWVGRLRTMQIRMPFALWTLVACLVALNCVLFGLLGWQRVEVIRLRSEIVTLQQALAARAPGPARLKAEAIPFASPDAFAKISESALHGSYRLYELGKDRGIVTLNANRTFTSEKGDNFPEYTWSLSRDRLVLQYRRIAAHYTSVEGPGVCVGQRTDNHDVRLEKLE